MLVTTVVHANMTSAELTPRNSVEPVFLGLIGGAVVFRFVMVTVV